MKPIGPTRFMPRGGIVAMILAAGLHAGLVTTTEAAPIVGVFEGTIAVPPPELASLFNDGDPIQLVVTLESTTPADLSSFQTARYDDAILALALTIGSHAYSWDAAAALANRVQISDNDCPIFSWDCWHLDAVDGWAGPSTAYALKILSVELDDASNDSITNLALAFPEDVATFHSRYFILQFVDDNTGAVTLLGGPVTSVQDPATVPEPGVWLLMASGLGLMLRRRGRLSGRS